MTANAASQGSPHVGFAANPRSSAEHLAASLFRAAPVTLLPIEHDIISEDATFLKVLLDNVASDKFAELFPEDVDLVRRYVVEFLEVCTALNPETALQAWYAMHGTRYNHEMLVCIDYMLEKRRNQFQVTFEFSRRHAYGVVQRIKMARVVRNVIAVGSRGFGFSACLPVTARALALLNLKPNYVYPRRFRLQRFTELPDPIGLGPSCVSFLIRHLPLTLPGFAPEQRFAKVLGTQGPCLWIWLARLKLTLHEFASVFTELGDVGTKARTGYVRAWESEETRRISDDDMTTLFQRIMFSA